MVLAVLAAACGISAGGPPESLPGGVVTPALAPPAATASSVPAADSQPAHIFLVSGTQIVDVPRTLPTPGLEPVLEVLLAGPTEAEVGAGIRSAITAGTRLRSTGVEDGIAVIDLTAEFVELAGEEQILAVAQLVLTATAVAGIDRVRFALDGEELEVPQADGTLAPGPLAAGDYASLRKESTPP